MEGCLGASNVGSVSPETVRRWIINVDNVLGTPIGRQKFYDFLGNSNFEEGQLLIRFWEMCHSIVPDESVILTKKKRLFSSKKTVDKELYNQVNELLLFANENINIDVGYLQRINDAIKSADYLETMKVILETKREAVLLLENFHSIFKEHLLQQRAQQ